jgi:hypothetical protein
MKYVFSFIVSAFIAVVLLSWFAGEADSATLSVQQKKILKHNMQRSINTVEWFQSKEYNWRLHPRFDTCMDVTRRYSDKRGSICYLSRLSYRAHMARLKRIDALLNPPLALPPHYNQWLCIRSYEAKDHHGGWQAATGNGYYGGLQMDISFQRAYGSALLNSKGTANNWTMLEQMWVAEEAYKTRGFYPWPNTARYCGLI